MGSQTIQSSKAQFLSNLTFIQHGQDSLLGKFAILKKTIMPFDYVRQYCLSLSNTQKWTVLQRIKQLSKLEGNCERLLTSIYDSQKLGCGTSPCLKVFFGYSKYTLKDILYDRAIKGCALQQKELLTLLKVIVSVLKDLQILCISHGYIKPQSIYYDQMHIPKLRISHLIRPNDKFQITKIEPRIFRSPQEIGISQLNSIKADCFALGMTILESMSLMDCYVLFYRDKKPSLELIYQQLNRQRIKYPRVCYILQMMLTKLPQQRADFLALSILLERPEKELPVKSTVPAEKGRDSIFSTQSNQSTKTIQTLKSRPSSVRIREVRPSQLSQHRCFKN